MLNKLLVNLSVIIIKYLWQKNIGKYYNKKYKIFCRFYPSCSEYAILALKKHGFIPGIKLIYGRLKRCNIYNTDTCIDFP